ncbi:ABC transporter permease [uncultured Litoreibacter sp.]|uniref:ABC transporter permease n=1 Tax=uncultured Litoreibacter sp. TaxID=1392394 RepID=UPI00261C1972|nr:ABC transporter permease [uncultured Litoreibacter sp.]
MDAIKRILSGRFALGALSITLVLGAYQLITMQPDNNPALLPPIPDIIASFFTNIEAGSLQAALGASLYRIFLGFFIGTTCALIIGCLVGWYKTVEYLIDPLIEAIRPIPPLAYIPIIIIWFGIEEFSRVLLISIACFMVCVVNVIAGMKNVPQVYVDAASTMGASRFQVFRTVAIPAATPFIITGYRIALAAAWTTLVAAELIAAPSGLGYMLQEGRRYFLTDQVMMIIVIIGACAFIMDRTFRAIQKRLMVWSEARE